MSTVPVETRDDFETREAGEASASGFWGPTLLGLAAVAITAFWVFALFVIIPGLFA